jgi:hypothetical protein
VNAADYIFAPFAVVLAIPAFLLILAYSFAISDVLTDRDRTVPIRVLLTATHTLWCAATVGGIGLGIFLNGYIVCFWTYISSTVALVIYFYSRARKKTPIQAVQGTPGNVSPAATESMVRRP